MAEKMSFECMQKKFSELIKKLVLDIVNNEFDKIESDGRIGRLTKNEVQEAIRSYPGVISPPPLYAFEHFELYEIDNSNSSQWAIEFEFWYDNSKSDLTLSASIEKVKDSKDFKISIDDIHTL